ncbi:hypothetical protein MSAR_03520 [Mycolicibacterium sarraceniae]|uniref:Uncharacterized protein n=1 Tax=Mycolicibacterium sarraceniae TaxID=1534348 RepID=A0A7I7SMW9_9MYCO|nr:hypothetical protein MSAR_03520 [Mycolicibacterium sarraceniae]
MDAAPRPEFALPARSRAPVITGALWSVLIVVINGESPLRRILRAGDRGVPVGGALLGVSIHRVQQGVDVDEGPLIGPRQQWHPLTQSPQVFTQDRFELPCMTEGELPQQGSHRRGCIHIPEQGLHPTGTHNIEVVDTVRASAHPGDQRGQLR